MSIKKELTKEDQLAIFKNDTKPVKIIAPCLLGDGIQKLSNFNSEELLENFRKLVYEKNCIKFVPASGAATRMFSDLIALRDTISEPTIEKIKSSDLQNKEELIYLFENLSKLPFYKKLNKFLPENLLVNESTILTDIINAFLDEDKLNLASKPKAILLFHNYLGVFRTPLYEHIQEAKELILKNGVISIHFTVSSEHQKAVEKRLKRITKNEVFLIDYSLSNQAESTNTIAVDMDNNPILDENGELVTRPGGHGALIFNMNKLNSDVVFIKNIDNVTTVPHNRNANKYKQLLSGYFYFLQDELFNFAKRYKKNPDNKALRREVVSFYKEYLFTDIKKDEKIYDYINRPLRVCAMVRNEGQPGGGPFFVEKNGKITPQIVELSQIDHSNKEYLKVLKKSTHFNPVDLVCGITDYEGNKFNLLDYVDETSYFISHKTHNGKQIKALELPGLWNGAMYHWNTAFVEMPIEYFNPVKTIFDLLDSKRVIK